MKAYSAFLKAPLTGRFAFLHLDQRPASSLSRSPGFLLLLASWLQTVHVLPWASWHSEALAIAALLWMAGVELHALKAAGQRQLAVPRASFWILLLAGYALAQCAFGQISYAGDAAMLAIYFALACIAFSVGYCWRNRQSGQPWETATDPVPQLAWTVLVGALLSVFLMLAQAFEVWQGTDWVVRTEGFRRPGANLGQPNQIATLLLMGVASLAYVLETGRLRAVMAWICLALLMLGLALSESRTALLSAAALLVWWAYHRRIFQTLHRPLPVFFAGGGLLALFWLWPKLISAWHQVEQGGSRLIIEPVGRWLVWPQLAEAVMQHPWAGWGLREVSRAHNAVLHAYAQGEPYTYAHNILLDLAIGLGLPLALAVIFMCGTWAWRRMRGVRSVHAWYGWALAVPVIVHSTLEYPYAYTYFMIPLMMGLGIQEAETSAQRARPVKTVHAGLAVAALTSVMLWSAIEYLQLEDDFAVARFEALHVGQTPAGYEPPKAFLLTQLDAMVRATRAKPAPGMSEEQIELLHKAALRFPWTAIQNRYALALALNGNPEEAMRQLKVMRAMHGERHYQALKTSWQQLAKDQFPALKQLTLP